MTQDDWFFQVSPKVGDSLLNIRGRDASELAANLRDFPIAETVEFLAHLRAAQTAAPLLPSTAPVASPARTQVAAAPVPDLAAQIAASGSEKALRDLWAANSDAFTGELVELAKSRIASLKENA